MYEIIFYRSVSGKCPVEDFLDTLTDKQFEKVAFVFDLIEQLETVPKAYLKKMKGTAGIWEIRVQYANDRFRFLGFMDKQELVALNHAFVKKFIGLRRETYGRLKSANVNILKKGE